MPKSYIALWSLASFYFTVWQIAVMEFGD